MTTIFPVVAAVPVFKVKAKPIGFPASASAYVKAQCCGSLKIIVLNSLFFISTVISSPICYFI
jgi:hypothetical protein